VKNPAGLDLGARGPEEIALSVLAQIVQERRAAPARVAARPAPAAAAEALDPVCGMTVRVAGARHHAQHAGRDFYFCAAVCRERFLAAPERYLAAATRP
jgi:xanthine dehydrogenase accessory factor